MNTATDIRDLSNGDVIAWNGHTVALISDRHDSFGGLFYFVGEVIGSYPNGIAVGTQVTVQRRVGYGFPLVTPKA